MNRGRKKTENRIRIEKLSQEPIGTAIFFTKEELRGRSIICGICILVGGSGWVKCETLTHGVRVTKVANPDRNKLGKKGAARSPIRMKLDKLYWSPIGTSVELDGTIRSSTQVHTWLNRIGGIGWARVESTDDGWLITKIASSERPWTTFI